MMSLRDTDGSMGNGWFEGWKPSDKCPQRRLDWNRRIELIGSERGDKVGDKVSKSMSKSMSVSAGEGIRPASRLVADQNLWPRHLLPFMR